MPTPGHRSLARADRIVELVTRSATAPTLTDIAHAVGAPLSSTQDLVRELCALGYLRRSGTRYVMGLRMHVLDLVGATERPTGIDHAMLERLSRAIEAPLGLAVLVGREVFYLDHAGPRAPDHIQSVSDDHRPRPTLRTAAGRLLLACSESTVRERLLADLRGDDPDAAAEFDRELPQIRRQRIARSDGLADPNIAAIAVPVDGTEGALVLTARRAPRGGRVPALEASARRLVGLVADL